MLQKFNVNLWCHHILSYVKIHIQVDEQILSWCFFCNVCGVFFYWIWILFLNYLGQRERSPSSQKLCVRVSEIFRNRKLQHVVVQWQGLHLEYTVFVIAVALTPSKYACKQWTTLIYLTARFLLITKPPKKCVYSMRNSKFKYLKQNRKKLFFR